jgi:hypothetical protein
MSVKDKKVNKMVLRKITSRIEDFRRSKCDNDGKLLTKVKFCEKINYSLSTYSNVSAKGVAPNHELLEALAKGFPELNIAWVVTGKGEMLNDPDSIEIKKGSFKYDLIEKFSSLPENRQETIFHELMVVLTRDQNS